jgi:hypothetical protein
MNAMIIHTIFQVAISLSNASTPTIQNMEWVSILATVSRHRSPCLTRGAEIFLSMRPKTWFPASLRLLKHSSVSDVIVQHMLNQTLVRNRHIISMLHVMTESTRITFSTMETATQKGETKRDCEGGINSISNSDS